MADTRKPTWNEIKNSIDITVESPEERGHLVILDNQYCSFLDMVMTGTLIMSCTYLIKEAKLLSPEMLRDELSAGKKFIVNKLMSHINRNS